MNWKKVFADVLDRKEAFQDSVRTSVYEQRKIRFFQKP